MDTNQFTTTEKVEVRLNKKRWLTACFTGTLVYLCHWWLHGKNLISNDFA